MIEVTDQQLLSFAEEEQFFLFCDRDEFIDIAKAVLYRFAPPAAPDVAGLVEALERIARHPRTRGDELGYAGCRNIAKEALAAHRKGAHP